MARERKMKRLMSGPLLSAFSRSSLWLTEDHLLSVEQRGMSERYRRFYFEDIQALVICGSERRFFIGLMLGVFLAIGLLVFAASSSEGGKIFGGVMMALFGVLLVVNYLKGPCCICELRTSVSSAILPAVRRLRKLERVLPKLEARVEQVQGKTDLREFSSAYEARQQMRPEVPQVGAPGPGVRIGPTGTPEKAVYTGGVNLLLFGLLLADGLLALSAFAGGSAVVVALRLCVIMAAAFAAIVALTRLGRAKVKGPLQVSTIVAMVYLAGGSLGLYGLFATMQIQLMETSGTAVEIFQMIAGWSPHDGLGWLLFFLGNAAISGLLGAFGLFSTVNYRADLASKQAPPVPTVS